MSWEFTDLSSRPLCKDFLMVFDSTHVTGLCWSSRWSFCLCVSDMRSGWLLHWLRKNRPFFAEGILHTVKDDSYAFYNDWIPHKGQEVDSHGFQAQLLSKSSNKEGDVTPCISRNASEKLLGIKLQLQLLATCDKRKYLEGFFCIQSLHVQIFLSDWDDWLLAYASMGCVFEDVGLRKSL